MSKAVEAPEKNWESVKYNVGDRVLWVTDKGKVPGTVISAFEAAGLRIYRIKLDEEAIIGRVFAREMRQLS